MSRGNTIQQRIEWGQTLWVYCHNPHCHHRAIVDLKMLRDKLGPDHRAMHDDLAPLLRCTKCNGERGRNIGLSFIPSSDEKKTRR